MGIAKSGIAMAAGVGIIDGGLTFYDRRSTHPNESVATSAALAGLDVALWTFAPGIAIAKEAFGVAKMMGEAGAFDYQKYESKQYDKRMVGGSWSYYDTEQAATMRQRGLEAISASRLSAKSALGGEARALHRGAL